MKSIPNCFYRVSVKGLVLDSKKRFLLTKEASGKWEFLGGGLEFGETSREALKREIKEETGLDTTFIADNPSYFLTARSELMNGKWFVNVFYLVKLKSFKIVPSKECIEAKFFTKEEALKENLFSNVIDFIALYDPRNH